MAVNDDKTGFWLLIDPCSLFVVEVEVTLGADRKGNWEGWGKAGGFSQEGWESFSVLSFSVCVYVVWVSDSFIAKQGVARRSWRSFQQKKWLCCIAVCLFFSPSFEICKDYYGFLEISELLSKFYMCIWKRFKECLSTELSSNVVCVCVCVCVCVRFGIGATLNLCHQFVARDLPSLYARKSFFWGPKSVKASAILLKTQLVKFTTT